MHRFMRFAFIILSLALLALGPVSAVGAANDKVTVVNLRGPLANAWLTSFDPSGCIETDTFVSLQRSTYQQLPAAKTTTGNLAVSIFEYNTCTGESVLNVVGDTAAVPLADIVFSNQLDRASVHASIPASNLDTGDALTIDVNVGWIGRAPSTATTAIRTTATRATAMS